MAHTQPRPGLPTRRSVAQRTPARHARIMNSWSFLVSRATAARLLYHAPPALRHCALRCADNKRTAGAIALAVLFAVDNFAAPRLTTRRRLHRHPRRNATIGC